MTRIQIALGLILLFGLGASGIERVATVLPRNQASSLAAAEAQFGAAQGELSFLRQRERVRGAARAAALELASRLRPEDEAQGVVSALSRAADRVGEGATAAVLGLDGRVLASSGVLAIDPRSRAVRDAGAAPWVLLERWSGTSVLVGAVGVGAAGEAPSKVVAVVFPINRVVLSNWLLDERIQAFGALLGNDGDVWISNLDGLPAKLAAPELSVGDGRYRVQLRQLEDDTGAVAQVGALAREDIAVIATFSGQLRLLFWGAGGLALILVLATLTVAGGRAPAVDEDEEEDEGAAIPRDHGQEDLLSMRLGPQAKSTSPANGFADDLLDGASIGPPRAPSLEPDSIAPAADFAASSGFHPGQVPTPPAPAYVPAPPAPLPLAFGPPSSAQGYGEGRPSPLDAMLPYQPENPRRVEHSIENLAPFVPPSSGAGADFFGGALGGPTIGRGMSPPPPGVAPRGVPSPRPLEAAIAEPPQLHRQAPPIVPPKPTTPTPAVLAERGTPAPGEIASYRPFDEAHYRVVYEEFVGSKQRLGEAVDNLSYSGFVAKLKRSEQSLIDKHGCRTVRFQVVVRDRQVSLRPQLVR